MSENKLYIAGAGSGKTTFIVNDALSSTDKQVLITTYTIENRNSIINKLYKINKFVPSNIDIKTWFKFLLDDGIRPYSFLNKYITGINFLEGTRQESLRYISEKDGDKYFCDNSYKLYTDTISKLAIRCNEKSDGYVIKRLEQIYSAIYIDEVQDLAGYDLDIIKLLIKSNIKIIMVGDPRQCVYLTHHEKKYERYKDGNIKKFVEEQCKNLSIKIDEETLNKSYRNSPQICELANALYPDHPPCLSAQNIQNISHSGIYLIEGKNVEKYISIFNAKQLRYSRSTEVFYALNVSNFGESKGLEYEHIIIYPTDKFLNWLQNSKTELKPTTLAKFYVAITRAFHSIAFVVVNVKKHNLPQIPFWIPEDKINDQ